MSSIVPSTSRRREAAIQTARRRIQRLEIETHRIKAELARLEAANEDDLADELTQELRESAWLVVDGRVARADHAANGVAGSCGPLTTPFQGVPPDVRFQGATPDAASQRDSLGNHSQRAAKRADLSGRRPQQPDSAPSPAIDLAAEKSTAAARGRRSSRKWLKPAWTVSLGLHVMLLLIGGLATYATLTDERFFLSASASDLPEETLVEPSEVEIEAVPTEEFEPQEKFVDTPHFEVGEHLLDSLIPALESGAVDAPGEVGFSSALPGDVGTLMAGGGDGKPGGGPAGSASFFGSHSNANRVVFVIDNSSSMKGGRLDAAVNELVRSVEAMTARQSFYVIFVSDQPYPMFYPVAAPVLLPATAPNKKRLREWLGGLQLAGGANRKLIDAMDLAASLEPETVFFLWDGDLNHSERVRRDVMLHLTRPQQWNFSIHTLGMGVKSPEDELNLSAVAQAHGGTYLRVDLAARKQ